MTFTIITTISRIFCRIHFNIKKQLWRISLWHTRQINVDVLLWLYLPYKLQRQPKTDSVSRQGNELGQLVYHLWYVVASHISFLKFALFRFSYKSLVGIYKFIWWQETWIPSPIASKSLPSCIRMKHVCINGILWEKGIVHEDRWLPVMAFPSVPELIASNQLSDIAQTQLKGMHRSSVHWSVKAESCKV